MAAWTPERCSCSPLHHSPRSSVHPEGAPNDDVSGVFMTDLGWLPPLSPFGASASPAAVGAGFFFFFHLLYLQKYTWNSNVCGNAWHAHLLFCCLVLSAHAHHFSLLSLCLSISSPSHPILSQSLSINKSFLAGCSRLNQPLCKHGC